MWLPLSAALLLAVAMVEVRGHGRLIDPPARSTMWRKGFQNVPVHYTDNELFCGGAGVQWNTHNGKCGVCGDEYGGPYDHEKGGKYYTDVIAKTYQEGQEFVAEVELTASHKGWFEFRVCAPDNTEDTITHACLDKNLLHITDGTTRHMVTTPGHSFHKVNLQLPAGVTCAFCVLQWKYHTGNSWGVDPDGKGCMGCGPQEEFYGCANIAIEASDGSVKPKPKPKPTTTPSSGAETDKPAPTWKPAATDAPSVAPGDKPTWKPVAPPTGNCRAADGAYKSQPGIDQWCVTNCAVGNCPASHCICDAQPKALADVEDASEPGCRAADGPWKSTPGMDDWCVANCALSYCPATHCICDVKRDLSKKTPNIKQQAKRARILGLLRELLKE